MNNRKVVAGNAVHKASWKVWVCVLAIMLWCGPAAMAATPSPADTTQPPAWVRIMRIPTTRDVNTMKCDVSGNNDGGDVWKQPFACVDYHYAIGTYKDRMYFSDKGFGGSIGYCNLRTHACKNVPYVAFTYNLKGPNTIGSSAIIHGTVYVSGDNYAASHHYPGYTLRSPGLIWLPKHVHNIQAAPKGKISYLVFTSSPAYTSHDVRLYECSAQDTDCRRILSYPYDYFNGYAWGPHGHLYLMLAVPINKTYEMAVFRFLGNSHFHKMFLVKGSWNTPFTKLPGGRFLFRDKIYNKKGKILSSIPPIPGVSKNDYGLFYSNNVLYAIAGRPYIIYRYNRPL